MRGFGTAVIDANPAPGEWDSAGRYQVSVNRHAAEGGGAVPATLYVMNDRTNLYIAFRVANATVGSSVFRVEFDNEHRAPRTPAVGDDAVDLTDFGFRDRFFRQSSPNTYTWSDDSSYGGSEDGAGLDGDHTGFSFYELRHPLDSADNAHDLSLRYAARVGFDLFFQHCITNNGCAAPTRVEAGDIVALSGSRIPPDTTISAGPVEGSISADSAPVVEFAGTDDVLRPPELTFECKVNDGAWRACTSPDDQLPELDDGRNTYFVRAVDEMSNADPSPAQRTWIVDTTGPSKPRVRGPRTARTSRPVYGFTARDAITSARRIRFKCAFDSKRLHRCAARYRQSLRPGRHTLTLRAVDSVGNSSPKTTIRITVKRLRG